MCGQTLSCLIRFYGKSKHKKSSGANTLFSLGAVITFHDSLKIKYGGTMEHIRYKKETEVVTFQGKEITLENLSPVFTPEQEAAKRRELEQQLYEVFRKYADKRQSEEAGA